jgi:hypothetical protein
MEMDANNHIRTEFFICMGIISAVKRVRIKVRI